VRYERGMQAAVAIVMAVFSGIAAAKSHPPRPFTAHAHFLATSTCIRGTWGTNLDVYLAEIVLQKGNAPVLVRLVDEYRNLDPPLAKETLTSEMGTTLRVRRDQICDMPYAQMQLRTAPGDPMAILHERLGYQPSLQQTPQPHELLPCYRNVRK
jgi:hypothetical protein